MFVDVSALSPACLTISACITETLKTSIIIIKLVVDTVSHSFTFRSFLDGLYAVADLFLENRPSPKPPDHYVTSDDPGPCPQPLGWCGLILTQCVKALCQPGTSTKKMSFDFFVKRRRKKLPINTFYSFN